MVLHLDNQFIIFALLFRLYCFILCIVVTRWMFLLANVEHYVAEHCC